MKGSVNSAIGGMRATPSCMSRRRHASADPHLPLTTATRSTPESAGSAALKATSSAPLLTAITTTWLPATASSMSVVPRSMEMISRCPSAHETEIPSRARMASSAPALRFAMRTVAPARAAIAARPRPAAPAPRTATDPVRTPIEVSVRERVSVLAVKTTPPRRDELLARRASALSRRAQVAPANQAAPNVRRSSRTSLHESPS